MADLTRKEVIKILAQPHPKYEEYINYNKEKNYNLSFIKDPGLLDLTDIKKYDKNFYHLSLRGIDLSGLDLQMLNFSFIDLSFVNFENTNLKGADLSYSNLSYANLKEANLKGADVSHSNLNYACLENASFELYHSLDDEEYIDADKNSGEKLIMYYTSFDQANLKGTLLLDKSYW